MNIILFNRCWTIDLVPATFDVVWPPFGVLLKLRLRCGLTILDPTILGHLECTRMPTKFGFSEFLRFAKTKLNFELASKVHLKVHFLKHS